MTSVTSCDERFLSGWGAVPLISKVCNFDEEKKKKQFSGRRSASFLIMDAIICQIRYMRRVGGECKKCCGDARRHGGAATATQSMQSISLCILFFF